MSKILFYTHFIASIYRVRVPRQKTDANNRVRELHKKDDPLWDGHLARPCVIRRPDARTTKNFGIFF